MSHCLALLALVHRNVIIAHINTPKKKNKQKEKKNRDHSCFHLQWAIEFPKSQKSRSEFSFQHVNWENNVETWPTEEA